MEEFRPIILEKNEIEYQTVLLLQAHKHFFALWESQDSDTRKKIDDYFIALCFSNKNMLVEPRIEGVKQILFEKYEFEYRNNRY